MRRILFLLFVIFAVGTGFCAKDAPFTSASNVVTATLSDYLNKHPVRLSGQVTTISAQDTIILKDNTGCTMARDHNHPLPEPGDLITLEGHLMLDSIRQRMVLATNVTIVGHAQLDPPRDLTKSNRPISEFIYDKVRVTGVLSSAKVDDLDINYNWISVRTPRETLHAACASKVFSLNTLKSLIDAEVSLSGVISPMSHWRYKQGVFLSVNELTVITQPPTDPFQAAEINKATTLHRQRATGIVLAVCRDCFYIKCHHFGQCIAVYPAEGTTLPQPDAYVEISGFVNENALDMQFHEALVRTLPEQQSFPAPEKITPPERFFPRLNPETEDTVVPDNVGRLVRLRGTIHYPSGLPLTEENTVFHVSSHVFHIDAEHIPALAKRLQSGSTVEIIGLCLARFTKSGDEHNLPQFQHFTIVPRTDADITVISVASWWTVTKLVWVIGSLLLVICIVTIWNFSLRRLSEQRGQQLAEEKIANLESQLKVEERTRLAVELHDSVSQSLTGVAMELETSRHFVQNNQTPLIQHLDVARRTLKSCREDMRNCLWDLRNMMIDGMDMTSAITKMLFPHTDGVRLSVRFSIPRDILSDTTAHAILRIIRELALNAIRHGKADQLKIAGSIEGRVLKFSVTDNGTGFDPESCPGVQQGHFGIQGIRERLSKMDGTLSYARVSPQGMKAVAILNIPSRVEPCRSLAV